MAGSKLVVGKSGLTQRAKSAWTQMAPQPLHLYNYPSSLENCWWYIHSSAKRLASMLSGLRRSSPDDHIIALWCADNCLGVRTTLWNKPLAAIPIWATILLGNNMWWTEDVAIHLLVDSSQLAFIEYEMRKVCCPCVLLIVSQRRMLKTLILYLTQRN